ncbi:hypothetical protein PIB30_086864, partial [Stylosanthes scabra]|nr:hypothetical protein [Stylosanthes scabra]
TKGRSSVARTSLRFPPPTKTYAQRGKKLKQPKGAEPEFNPVANAISNSDNGTFQFTRTKARTRGVVGGDRGSGSRQEEAIDPEWSDPEDLKRNVKNTTYITTSTLRIPYDYGHPNYLQQQDTDTSKWADDIGAAIPKALGNIMTFLPTPDMNIVGLHLAIAAFVFNKSLDPKEEVVHTSNYQVTRSMLRSLEPGQMVREEVLILLANMLSKDSGEEHWFLPATIMIYCPLWTEGHWMLLVIDLNREELVCLDSDRKTGPRYARRRRRAIKNVALFLEELTDEDDWFDDPEAARPEMSDFKPKLPAVPQQDPGSNDSGMFVAQWMIIYHLWGTYNVEKIIPYSRMRLAIDLVLRVQNDLGNEVSEGAVSYWRKFAGDLPPSP